MKTIKIMIAASEEMHDEKLKFNYLIEHLNEVLEPRGIELKRIKWNPETDGSIEEYKTKLKECEMCLTLYWHDLAGNSEQELDTAYQELKDGNNPRNLYVFFKEPTEDLTDTLRDFKANFVTKYGHFFCKFENVDTMNLHFILQFEAYQNHLRNKDDQLVKVTGGKVTVANKEFVNLGNVPFAALNKEYQRLQKELLEIDIQVTEVRKRHIADPENEDVEDELMAIKSKRKKQAEEFEKYQTHLYDIALNFAKTTGEKHSERMHKARELFEMGDVIGADQILNMEEMKHDRQRESEQKNVHEKNLEILMNEIKKKKKTVMTNTLFSIPERFRIACEAYEEAISIAREIHLDEEDKYIEILYDYAFLLLHFKKYSECLPLFQEILKKRKDQAIGVPYDYTKKVAVALSNLASPLVGMHKYEEAEKCYREVLEILQYDPSLSPLKYDLTISYTLGNLSNLLKEKYRYKEAENVLYRALDIRKAWSELESEEENMSGIASLLYKLADLHYRMNELVKAKQEYEESLDIRRRLAISNYDKYMSEIASSINGISHVNTKLEQYKVAEEGYYKALDIYMECEKKGVLSDQSGIADSWYNLASLHDKIGRYSDSEREYLTSLKIYRKLTENNTLYMSDVAYSLNALAVVQDKRKKYTDAEINYNEPTLKSGSFTQILIFGFVIG